LDGHGASLASATLRGFFLEKNMNKYITFYRKQQLEVEAETSFEAQVKAAKIFKAKKNYQVTVVLAETNDKPITHTPDF
jgi:hypothetical protein